MLTNCRSQFSSMWSMVRGRSLAPAAVVLLLTQGCIGSVVLLSSWGVRPELLPIGSSREEVEAKLGRLIASRPTSDGGRVDIYEYEVYREGGFRDVPGGSIPWGNAFTGQGALLLPLAWQAADTLYLLPYAAYRRATQPRSQIEIAFGPDDRVVWIGSPPPYGPPDDGVGPPSIGAIRKGCWSQENIEPPDLPVSGGENLRPSEDLYVRCVARGFAIWGIE